MNPFRIRHFNHTPRLKTEHPGNESKCTMIGPSEAGLFLGSFKTSSVSILKSLASMIISTLIVSSRISSSFLQLLLSHHKLCLTDNINANTDLVNTPLVSKFQTSEFPFFLLFFFTLAGRLIRFKDGLGQANGFSASYYVWHKDRNETNNAFVDAAKRTKRSRKSMAQVCKTRLTCVRTCMRRVAKRIRKSTRNFTQVAI